MAVAFGRFLRVYRQREPRVGVTESALRCLQVDALGNEAGGIGPPQVVELETLDAGRFAQIRREMGEGLGDDLTR